MDVADIDKYLRVWVEVTEGFDGLNSCDVVGNAVFFSEHVGDQDRAHCFVLKHFGVGLQPLLELLGGLQMNEEGCLVDLAHVMAELIALALLSVDP